MEANASQKREVKVQAKSGMDLKDLILVAVLIAAGAVLKFFVGTFVNFGFAKPNFIVPMYCLAIMLIKPNIRDAAIVGLIAGAACQFFAATPGLNFASELVGAIVMSILIKLPAKIGKLDLSGALACFVATIASGGVYIVLINILIFSGVQAKSPALLVFAYNVLITAVLFAVMVSVLYKPLKLAFKKEN